MESLSEMIWDCFKQLGVKLDKDIKVLKEAMKEGILYSKDWFCFHFKKDPFVDWRFYTPD